MKTRKPSKTRRSEAGIALLISIFVLLLISVVAIALIVSSGTESALAGNYRSSTGVYYAALSGLEEARGRLLAKNPSAFKITNPTGFLPAAGTPLNIGDAYYVINPVGGETVAPWDVSTSTTYPDLQFGVEFASSGFSQPPNPSPWANSVWNRSPLNSLNIPGPLYKWVRINAVSEKSLNLDVDNDTLADSITPLYYNAALSPPRFSNDPSVGPQILEITSFAATPNGSQKILQYLAAPVPINMSFNAALTLDGTNVGFAVPTSSNFWVRGNDSYSVGSCNPGPGTVAAVGYTSDSPDPSLNNILNAIPSGPPPGTPDRRSHYTNGNPGLDPNVSLVSLPPNMQTVASLNSLVNAITEVADAKITGPATYDDLPAAMSYSNPMTIVVNGNLSLAGWQDNTGYGLLLVTGDFTWDPDSTWKGIVLVIGTGRMTSSHGNDGEIDGAVFLAKTSPPGSPSFVPLTNQSPAGILYSSCWIQKAMPAARYKILSFHEIPQ